MAGAFDHLVVELGLETGKFTMGLASAVGALKTTTSQFSVSFSRMGAELASVTKLTAMLGVGLTTVAAGGLTAVTLKAFEAGDAFNEMSERMGVSVEQLQRLDYAASMTGATIGDVESAMKFAARAMSEASAGGKAQADAFRELGLSVAALRGMSPDQQFYAIADALAKVQDKTDQTRLRLEVFGRGAQSLAVMTKDGAAGITRLGDEFDSFGVTLDKQGYNKLEMAWEALQKLGTIAAGVGRVFAEAVSPYVIKFATDLGNAAKSSDGFREAIEWAVDVAVKGADYALTAWNSFSIAWSAVKVGVAGLSVAFYSVADAVAQTVSWIGTKVSILGELIGDSFALAVELAKHAWVSLKVSATAVMDSVVFVVGKAVELIGRALSYLPGSVGKTVEEAGKKIADGAYASTQKAADELGLQAKAVKSAWNDAADTTARLFTQGPAANAVTDWTKRNLEESKNLLSDYVADLSAKVSQPLVSTFAKDWAANAKKNVDAATKPDETPKDKPKTALEPWSLSTEDRARMEEKLQALRDFTSSESELELNAFNERMISLDEMRANGLIGDEEYYRMQESLMSQHSDRMLEIEDASAGAMLKTWKSGLAGKMQVASQMLGNIATLMNSKSKQMFEVGKIAAYAQTVVNTAEAAMSCFKFGAALGGPIVGAAFAATAVAAGMVQLQNIRSASFGGGGGVSSGGGGGATAASAPMPGELNNRGIPTMQSQRVITVNIQGENFTRAQVQDLIDQINEAQRDGNRID